MIAAFFTLLLAALAYSAKAAEPQPLGEPSPKAFNWYCKNNNTNSQPELPSEFNFINNYNSFWRGEENCGKVIYLTFDAGYENGNVAKILEILDSRNIKGAFFVLDNFIRRNAGLVKKMHENGHLICNHTSNHKDMTKLSGFDDFALEITSLEQTAREIAGIELAKFYRPPCGTFSERDLAFASRLGYKTIFWSYAYADWDNKAQILPEKALEKLYSHVHEGMILLLHPTSETNTKILGDFLDKLIKDGWSFSTLDQLANNHAN